MDLDGFRDDVKGGSANFSNWRSRGKLIAFLHPKGKIGKRVRVRFRKVVYNEESKEKEIWTIPRFYYGDEDITAKFLKWLKGNDDIDADDVVLRIKLAKKTEEYLKGDLLGMDDYDWKKRLFRPRTEYLFSMVDSEKPAGTEIVTLPWGAGKKLMKKIDSQIEEYGEEDGNPFENPYPFKITFDESERGTEMYDVERHQAKLKAKVKKIFEKSEPDDTLYFCDPTEENLEHGTSIQLLRDMCVVDCPLLEKDVEEQEAPAKEKKTKKVKKPKKEKKKKPKSDMIAVEDCEEGVTYEYDGDELRFKRFLPKTEKYLFIDDDGEKIRLAADAEVKAVKIEEEPEADEPEEEPEKAEPKEVKVEDCEEGETYYDSDGDTLTFVRFNHKKEKGIFKDEDGDKILFPGDDVVFTESPTDGDELDPVPAGKKETKQTKPKGKVKEEKEDAEEEGDEEGDDDEDVMECPYCDKDVKANAKKCPHCGGEFDDEKPFD